MLQTGVMQTAPVLFYAADSPSAEFDMTGQPHKHGTGDRNNDHVARKDHEIHRKRDEENRQNDRKRDRADETGTGNREPAPSGKETP